MIWDWLPGRQVGGVGAPATRPCLRFPFHPIDYRQGIGHFCLVWRQIFPIQITLSEVSIKYEQASGIGFIEWPSDMAGPTECRWFACFSASFCLSGPGHLLRHFRRVSHCLRHGDVPGCVGNGLRAAAELRCDGGQNPRLIHSLLCSRRDRFRNPGRLRETGRTRDPRHPIHEPVVALQFDRDQRRQSASTPQAGAGLSHQARSECGGISAE